MLRLPYGISNFRDVRTQGYVYVDKTIFLERLEKMNSKYLFFIRPRRFGKSLFLSALAHYYDVKKQDEFQQLFGDLYIGKNPTPLKNSYLVLELDFSGLDTTNKTQLAASFKTNLKAAIKLFFAKYQTLFPDLTILQEQLSDSEDIRAIFEVLLNEIIKIKQKLYLIIDEYDHFANDIIAMGDGIFYKDLIRAAGLVRDFYETVKIGTKTVIDRIFITGISPIMLDDLTSGFSIATNITMDASCNAMLGFTEMETINILNRMNVNTEVHLARLRECYNGYIFNPRAGERIYNPEMVLYYLDHFTHDLDPLVPLYDDNIKIDYGRLNRLTTDEKNRLVLEEIIRDEKITTNIITRFSFDRMNDREYFISLLFYLGLLTIKSIHYGFFELGIPNYVVKTIFWEYFERQLRDEGSIHFKMEELGKTVWEMAYHGQLRPFLHFINTRVIRQLSHRDQIRFDEKHIKVILFAYLTLTNMYKPVSEREVDNGYIDIYLERDLRVPEVKYEWLLELKYLKKTDLGKLEAVKAEGIVQLQKYAVSKGMEGKKDLRKALVIFKGKDEYELFEDT